MNFPPFDPFPVLRGERIVLRQIQPADIPGLVSISWYDGVKAATAKEAGEMMDRIHKDYEAGESVHWGIASSETDEIMGTCGYYRGFNDGSGELGCIMLPANYGKGFMTEALQAAIRYGFENMKLSRVFAITTPINGKALSLLVRLGFQPVAGSTPDEVRYEISRS